MSMLLSVFSTTSTQYPKSYYPPYGNPKVALYNPALRSLDYGSNRAFQHSLHPKSRTLNPKPPIRTCIYASSTSKEALVLPLTRLQWRSVENKGMLCRVWALGIVGHKGQNYPGSILFHTTHQFVGIQPKQLQAKTVKSLACCGPTQALLLLLQATTSTRKHSSWLLHQGLALLE